ncbi:G-protein coupled receptors family 1 profile domain-containing protein [Caenorhabditis elegans]|uniref:G-protein coupled receptors family 1 profile domain-containing protein n=1 Tax=Caenorhabditis elegans TaxID=6239 RepID=O45779_CAEEL|nr:G-protein coupled receptors family 1 profile domain-containing protein [Caenorhabditis elegans]CAB03338.2 G-protein coupled receptors family 1 profile domain-containing protein [Caenorhabditis elegans]|eukprot:NP_506786.2 Serpentine Receptor, class X [Caenorhabditis elegans]
MISSDQIAALAIFSISSIGVLANWTVAILIRRLPSLKNSFGMLTTSQSIGDAVISTIFAFLIAPMCFFNLEYLKTYSSVIGHVLIIAYEISTYSHLCISLNRFCAIVAPIKYENIFSIPNTNKLIAFFWASATLPSFYLYVYNDCKFYFADIFWVFTFSDNPVCNTIAWYAGFLKYNSIVISIVIIDVITVSKVRSYKAKVFGISTHSASKSSYEMNFLKQACLQAFVFVCELVTYFLITPKMDPSERWACFVLSTVAWISVHTLDGIITLSFNKEFTNTIFGNAKPTDLSTAAEPAEIPSNVGSTSLRL